MMLEFIPVILLVITLLYYLFGQRHQRLFPGPSGVPLFGVTFEVDKYRLHLSLYEWSKKYGDIFQFSVFGKSYVSLNSPEVIREVMGQEPSATVTSSRENTFFGNYIVGEDTDIVFASYSKEWAKRRKIASQIMQIYGEGNPHSKGYETVHRREPRTGHRSGFYGGIASVEGFDVIGNW